MRALLVTDADPSRSACWRRAQLAELIGGFGLAVDLVLRREGGTVPETGFAERLAVVRDDAGVGAAISALEGDTPYEIVVSTLTHLAPFRQARGALQLADVPRLGPIPSGYDIVLAPTEAERIRCLSGAPESYRLPETPRGLAVPSRPGAMCGWAGAWPEGLAAAINESLDLAAERVLPLPGGLLFAGAGAREVRVPGVHARRSVVTERASPLALGLALLPVAEIGEAMEDVLMLIAARCPVLLLSDAAQVFEDRWHLPTSASPRDMVDLVAAWQSGEMAPALAEATRWTSNALAEDRERMQAYVAERIAQALAARAPS